MTLDHDKATAAILERFYFAAVRKHMEATGWTWRNSDTAPTEEELRGSAAELLAMLAGKDDGFWVSSGGFRASIANGVIRLSFEVEHEEYPDEIYGDAPVLRG